MYARDRDVGSLLGASFVFTRKAQVQLLRGLDSLYFSVRCVPVPSEIATLRLRIEWQISNAHKVAECLG